jgi:catechol 2,3-dioxygenase-like lactoylglutathione lyase family enzyme
VSNGNTPCDIAESAMKLSFDCIFYYVSDIERAVDFYSNILGLKLISQDVVARFDIDGVLFELVPTKAVAEIHGGGNARLCLKSANVRDAIRELQLKGVSVSEPNSVEGGILATVNDPDGNEILLWQGA